MKRHESNQQDPSSRSGNHTLRKSLALAVGPMLVAAACSGAAHKSGTAHRAEAPAAATVPATTPKAEVTTTTQGVEKINENTANQAKESVRSYAIQAANSVLDILANPRAGTENYDGTRVGNKSALVGPDLVYPSADDTKYRNFPESLAYFDPKKGTILIRAYGEENETSPNPSFWSVDTEFSVSPANPIRSKTGQLTVDDFREALNAGGSVDLVAAGAETGWSFNLQTKQESGAQVSLAFGPNGIFAGIGPDASVVDLKGFDNPIKTEADLLHASQGLNQALSGAATHLVARADLG